MTFRARADGEPQRAGVRGEFRLPAAVVFEPAEVVGELADGRAVFGRLHGSIIADFQPNGR